jgi:hypothetical protein
VSFVEVLPEVLPDEALAKKGFMALEAISTPRITIHPNRNNALLVEIIDFFFNENHLY